MLPTLLFLICQTVEPPRLAIQHQVVAYAGPTDPGHVERLGDSSGEIDRTLEGFLSESGTYLFLRRFEGSSGIMRYELGPRRLVIAEPTFAIKKDVHFLGTLSRSALTADSELALEEGHMVQAHASLRGTDVLVSSWSEKPGTVRTGHRWYSGVGVMCMEEGLFPMIAGGVGLGRVVQPILDVQDLSMALVVAGVGTLTVPDEMPSDQRRGSVPEPDWPRAKWAPRIHDDFLRPPTYVSDWREPRQGQTWRLLWNSHTSKVVGAFGAGGEAHYVGVGRADGSKPVWLRAPQPEGRAASIKCLSLTKDDRVFAGVYERDTLKGGPWRHIIYEVKDGQWVKIADARLRATNTQGTMWLVEREDATGGWLVRLL